MKNACEALSRGLDTERMLNAFQFPLLPLWLLLFHPQLLPTLLPPPRNVSSATMVG